MGVAQVLVPNLLSWSTISCSTFSAEGRAGLCAMG